MISTRYLLLLFVASSILGATGQLGATGATGKQGPMGAAGPPGRFVDEEGDMCDEVNDCTNDPVAVCVDLLIGYECRCPNDLKMPTYWDDTDLQCKFVNGATDCCEIENGGCDQFCVPGATIAERTCDCRDGYVLADDDEDCIAVDPCDAANDCDADPLATCVGNPFVPTEYDCTCPVAGKVQSVWDGTACVLPNGAASCCDIDNGGCDQKCEPGATILERTCSCDQPGYTLADDMEDCIPIGDSPDDPCDEPNDCDNTLAVCYSNAWGYQCLCPMLCGHQTVWNETEKNCVFPGGEQSCCEFDNGGCDQTCTPGTELGDRTCSCGDGYTLNSDNQGCTKTGDSSIDPCEQPNDCDNTVATCDSNPWGYRCECPVLCGHHTEWDDTAKNCVFPGGEQSCCDFDNGGCDQTCTPGAELGDRTCSCGDGYTLNSDNQGCTKTGDSPEDPCEQPNDCDNTVATCDSNPWGYRCECPVLCEHQTEWDDTAKNCVFPGGEQSCCDIDNGGCDQTCTPGAELGDRTCSCGDGYTLAPDNHDCIKNGDSNDDPCDQANDCDNTPATCVPTPWGYKCLCPVLCGHQPVWDDAAMNCVFPNGEQSCCDFDNGGCDQTCTPGTELGDRTCSCGDGYTLAADNEDCIKTGDSLEDPCDQPNDCDNTVATCDSNPWGYRCECPVLCGHQTEWDDSMKNCVFPGGEQSCCDFDNGGCDQTCTPGAELGDRTCSCGDGYTLAPDNHDCIKARDSPDDPCGQPNNCSNTLATCVSNAWGYQCLCPEICGHRTVWDDVEKECVFPNGEQSCCDFNNGGCDQTCNPTDALDVYYCDCETGYSLANDNYDCTEIDECQVAGICDGQCSNAKCEATCKNTPGSYKCNCAACQNIVDGGNVGANLEPGDTVDTTVDVSYGFSIAMAVDLPCSEVYDNPESTDYQELEAAIENKMTANSLPAVQQKFPKAQITDFQVARFYCNSNGIVVAVVDIGSDSIEQLSEVEARQVTQQAYNSLKDPDTSAVFFQPSGPSQAIQGFELRGTPIVDFSKTNSFGDVYAVRWPLVDDACEVFDAEDICYGDSTCQSVDDVPTCICPSGYTGETCDEQEAMTMTLFGQSLEGVNGSLLLSLLLAASLMLGLCGLVGCCMHLFMRGGVKPVERVMYKDEETPRTYPREAHIEYIKEVPEYEGYPEYNEQRPAYDMRYNDVARPNFHGLRMNPSGFNSRFSGTPW